METPEGTILERANVGDQVRTNLPNFKHIHNKVGIITNFNSGSYEVETTAGKLYCSRGEFEIINPVFNPYSGPLCEGDRVKVIAYIHDIKQEPYDYRGLIGLEGTVVEIGNVSHCIGWDRVAVRLDDRNNLEWILRSELYLLDKEEEKKDLFEGEFWITEESIHALKNKISYHTSTNILLQKSERKPCRKILVKEIEE
jgi:hypothetical protein